MKLNKIIYTLSAHLLKFWLCHPALFYGTAFLLGTFGALSHPLSIVIPCTCLWLPFLLLAVKEKGNGFNHLCLNLLTTMIAFSYTSIYYQFPSLPLDGIEGTAHMHIDSLSSRSTYFGKTWNYSCQLENFHPTESTHPFVKTRHLKCSISIPHKTIANRPPANQDYLVQGTLKQTQTGQYFFKIKKKEEWKPVIGSWSLAESRYQAKTKFKKLLSQIISHPKSSLFLAGIATGDFDDRLMQQDFARFGLQHIMAISGFHFAIIASILGVVFRLFLPRKLSAFLLICLLGVYFFFLGATSSILRAWITISIALLGSLIEKKGKALNSLGLALLIVLIFDPLLCQTLGFQFSFLVTAAILFLSSSVDQVLTHLLPKRHLSQVVEMNGWDQHGYYFLSLFRQGLALTLAVNLFALPLTLYHFHQFPVMSLLYNLFFPLLVSFSMLLLILGLLTSFPLCPVGGWIHALNSSYTQWVLSLTSNIPSTLDVYVESSPLPSWLLVLYLCGLIVGSIVTRVHDVELA